MLTLGAAGLLVVLALLAVRALGLEFLPKLEEGNFWIRATMPPSISLEEGNGYVNRMRKVIRQFPGGGDRRSPSTAGPMTAPMPPGFSTPSSSCRSSRSTHGRAA